MIFRIGKVRIKLDVSHDTGKPLSIMLIRCLRLIESGRSIPQVRVVASFSSPQQRHYPLCDGIQPATKLAGSPFVGPVGRYSNREILATQSI